MQRHPVQTWRYCPLQRTTGPPPASLAAGWRAPLNKARNRALFWSSGAPNHDALALCEPLPPPPLPDRHHTNFFFWHRSVGVGVGGVGGVGVGACVSSSSFFYSIFLFHLFYPSSSVPTPSASLFAPDTPKHGLSGRWACLLTIPPQNPTHTPTLASITNHHTPLSPHRTPSCGIEGGVPMLMEPDPSRPRAAAILGHPGLARTPALISWALLCLAHCLFLAAGCVV